MTDPATRTLSLAEKVSAVLAEHGIECALIGAGAMAVHGYARGTTDLDFAVEADLVTGLQRVRRSLIGAGLAVELRSPDPDDPLGGVLDVRGADGELVQVVNFHNDWNRGAGMLPSEAIREAELFDFDGFRLRVARPAHLVALKVYAGGPKSASDVLGLLEANPETIEEVREVCARHGLTTRLERLLAMDEDAPERSE